jgi:hypothetical protein
MPTGMLTRKIQGHERVWTRMPPSSRGDDRECRRRDERGAETLQAAAHDQPGRAGRNRAQQRGTGEQHEADEEDLLPPGEVAGPAAEEEEAAEQQRVRVHDPLQVGLGHVEIFLDRRQRNVDDRRVEDDHELRQADEDEDEPGIYMWELGASGHCSKLAARPRATDAVPRALT